MYVIQQKEKQMNAELRYVPEKNTVLVEKTLFKIICLHLLSSTNPFFRINIPMVEISWDYLFLKGQQVV
jgi:hypothetical protein